MTVNCSLSVSVDLLAKFPIFVLHANNSSTYKNCYDAITGHASSQQLRVDCLELGTKQLLVTSFF